MLKPYRKSPVISFTKKQKHSGLGIPVFLLFILMAMLFSGCSENYSNGERIGLITQFSKTGLIWKSWEGELHVTQTGMNSTMNDFEFSIDNDREDQSVISQIDSAALHGWKVKLTYHETFGKNWFSNRGETNHFITGVQILDRNPVSNLFGREDSVIRGRVVDTIYVVIDKSKN